MPSSLPITSYLEKIQSLLRDHQNLILQAEPGAGKSTLVPLDLLSAEWLKDQKIIMLEPRRMAAKSISHYLSQLINEPVGHSIGYQIKNEKRLSRATKLEIVTEGILARRIQNDPELEGVGLLIFDEFHERSLQADLALMLALEAQQTIREDLRILVMSATIKQSQISDYLNRAPVLLCPGRSYPVEVRYLKSKPGAGRLNGSNLSRDLVKNVSSAVISILSDNEPKGDILVFLPGKAEINKSIEAVERLLIDTGIESVLVPLYGGLTIEQQEKAIKPDSQGRRRIIFSTNIAETSLTIEGVTWVIDSGLEKVMQFNPANGMSLLLTTKISKASAEQRKGRAGRLQPGTCIRLWSDVQQASLQDYQIEEVKTADLSALVLELYCWGVSSFDQVNWLTPPPRAHFEQATSLLVLLGLINEKGVTDLGRKAMGLGIHPRLAAMVLSAESITEREIACYLAALLNERDILVEANQADILSRMLIAQEYGSNPKPIGRRHSVRANALAQVMASTRSLLSSLEIKKGSPSFTLTELNQYAGPLLFRAYPDRLAKRRVGKEARYQLANGKGVYLLEEDGLADTSWLVVSDCDAQKREGRIFQALSISPDQFMPLIEDKCIEKKEFQYEHDKSLISGQRALYYHAIKVSEEAIRQLEPEEFQEILMSSLKDYGLGVLNWNDSCQSWLMRSRWLASIDNSFPEISEKGIIEQVDQWLFPYIPSVNKLSDLKKVNILPLLKGILTWQQQDQLDQDAPEIFTAPTGKTIPIHYALCHGPKVSIVLQEMFGELRSPMLAGGRIPLTFELLSPARRPIQTTSNLETFWQTSYFDVAKEMKGRYPKHRWPSDPMSEKPGRSVKRKQ